MKILGNFGFEPVFFTAQIINFLILFYIFKRFLYKPVLKLLKSRTEAIAQGLADAEMAKIKLEEAEIQKDKIIAQAALEAEKIIKETKANAQTLRDEILNKSYSEAEKIIEQARDAARLELASFREQSQNIAVELTKKVLDKVLADFFSKREREKIFSRSINRILKYE